MIEWLLFYNKTNATTINYRNLQKNPPHKIVNIPLNEYVTSLDEFRMRDYIRINPAKEIFDWFLEKGDKYRHIALTAVPLNCAHLSADWIIMNFGQWIRSFNFIPSKREGRVVATYDKTKADLMSRIGNVDLFIDDNEDNIDQAKKQGINTILFPRPWNSNRTKNIKWFLFKLDKSLE